MNKEKLFKELNECYSGGDLSGIRQNIKRYQKDNADDVVSRDFSEYIYLQFTTFRADSMAGIMQMMIESNSNLALLKFPENYFFRMVVIKGSMDLYECFIEEAVEPFLKDKDEEERGDYYAELYGVASNLSDHFFPQYVPCVKGMDFNGIFGKYENNAAISLINTVDYETLDDVVEKYNTIIGRRDIVKNLEERMC